MGLFSKVTAVGKSFCIWLVLGGESCSVFLLLGHFQLLTCGFEKFVHIADCPFALSENPRKRRGSIAGSRMPQIKCFMAACFFSLQDEKTSCHNP